VGYRGDNQSCEPKHQDCEPKHNDCHESRQDCDQGDYHKGCEPSCDDHSHSQGVEVCVGVHIGLGCLV